MKPLRPLPPDRGRGTGDGPGQQETGERRDTQSGEAGAGAAGVKPLKGEKKQKQQKNQEDLKVAEEEESRKWSQDAIVPETQQSQDEDEEMQSPQATDDQGEGRQADMEFRSPGAGTSATSQLQVPVEPQSPLPTSQPVPEVEARASRSQTDASRNVGSPQRQTPSPQPSADHGEGGQMADNVPTQTASRRQASGVPWLDEAQTVEPEEMFKAVVTAMKANTREQPRDEWVTTVAELYALGHHSVTIDEEHVPSNKKRYPKLRGEEKALLYNLFRELNVVENGTYAEWMKCILQVTQDLLNTRWTFKNIMYSRISKARWARTPPLNQWAAKVQTGLGEERPISAGGPVTDAQPGRYEPFMFNPASYSKQEMIKLCGLCEQVHVNQGERRLRAASADEWKVIVGMAEGTIACRRMPDFLSSVFDSLERLRLHTTIQQQVEGELVMQLRGRARVNDSRQKTRLIKEDILLDAAKARINVHELHQMLNLAKTIAYNDLKRSIHIFFFDSATAARYQGMQVPFRGGMYSLVNMHRPDTGSVWARQLDRDGVRRSAQPEYVVEIHNLTRFTDMGRLTAYLKQHLGVRFELVNMDSFTPNSMRTTAWHLKIISAECPEYLRGIVRILWFGRTLVLKHPYALKQLQCFRCGNLGHIKARCQLSTEALRGAGCRIADDHQVAGLDNLAKSFASESDKQRSMEARLKVKEEEYRQEEAAVAPVSPPKPVPSPVSGAQHLGGGSSFSEDGLQRSVGQPAKPTVSAADHWVTVPLTNGRKLYAHPAALQNKGIKVSSHYSELFDADEDSLEEESKSEDQPPLQDVVELSSGSDPEVAHKRTITAAEKSKLHFVKAKLPKLPATSKLVALKQRQQGEITAALGAIQAYRGDRWPVLSDEEAEITSFEQIEGLLGMKEVSTPASGNCMAMALAQAVADHNLAAMEATLERVTAAIKRGIWAGQLNCMEQFDHFTRTATLVNMGRGWDGMDPKESSKQFRWYLQEYALSSSKIQDHVPRHNWGQVN